MVLMAYNSVMTEIAVNLYINYGKGPFSATDIAKVTDRRLGPTLYSLRIAGILTHDGGKRAVKTQKSRNTKTLWYFTDEAIIRIQRLIKTTPPSFPVEHKKEDMGVPEWH